MFKNPILDIEETPEEDVSIIRCETYDYYPITGSQLDSPGNIALTVQNNDNFFYPAGSWLEFEGQLVKAVDSQPYTADNGKISFVNCGILYLFDFMKYQLNSGEIEAVFNPGMVANIVGLATLPDKYVQGLIECWYPDTGDEKLDAQNEGYKQRRDFVITSAPDPLGFFRFSVPLRRIFGFADDFHKIIYGFRHNLILTRGSSDHNALCHKDDVAQTKIPPGKVTLKHIRWRLPRVEANDVAKYELLQLIKNETTVNCAFRMRQCISTSVPKDTTDFTWRLGIRSCPDQPR